MLEWMRTDPLMFFRFMLYRAPAVLVALLLHEIAHGWVAYRCGDTTAKDMGRLSLNPLKHLSLVGTLLMFTVGVGYAKPVPVNPNNLRHPRRDHFFVAIAGVTMNFFLFLLATLLAVWVNGLLWDPRVFELGWPCTTRLNFLSFQGENFMELLTRGKYVITETLEDSYYVLDASAFMRTPWLVHVQCFLYQLMLCNLGACLFNLLPFPPLDGFHVVNDVLLRGKLRLNVKAFRISMLALLLLLNVTDFFSNLLFSGIAAVQTGVLRAVLAVFGLS